MVRQVSWSAGEVTVDCLRGKREQTVRASAAIVTVPIGVWKAAREQEGSILFDPALDEKTRAIAKLEVGHVVKIMFRFRERFWEECDRDEPLAFIHSTDRFVPAWWTHTPVRSPILTAWAGGHAAGWYAADGVGLFPKGARAEAEIAAARRSWGFELERAGSAESPILMIRGLTRDG